MVLTLDERGTYENNEVSALERTGLQKASAVHGTLGKESTFECSCWLSSFFRHSSPRLRRPSRRIQLLKRQSSRHRRRSRRGWATSSPKRRNEASATMW